MLVSDEDEKVYDIDTWMARTAFFSFSNDLVWKFSGSAGFARRFLITSFLAPDPMAAFLMLPVGNDLMPFEPTDNAEKF